MENRMTKTWSGSVFHNLKSMLAIWILLACMLSNVGCFFLLQENPRAATRVGFPRKRSINHWSAGNVEADFDRLERAIKLDSAEDDLTSHQRVCTLDYMASSRKDIAADIISFAKGPLTLSFMLALLFCSIAGSRILSAINKLSIVHFSLSTIICPLVLLARRSRRAEERPEELVGIGDKYLKFLTSYENPKVSCQDVVLCILELWSFTVLPSLLFRPWATQRRLLTRLGAFACLRQYPLLSYKLWYQQPRPLSGMVVALRTASKLMSSKTAFAIDLALLVGKLHYVGILYIYGLILISGSFLSLCLNHIKPRNKFWSITWRFGPRLLFTSFIAGSIWKLYKYLVGILTRESSAFALCVSGSFSHLTNVMSNILAIASYFGIAWTLIDVQQNMRVAYTHKDSLSKLLPDELGNDSTQVVDSSFRWRYWHSWRDPQRIYVRMESLYERFCYWLLFEGTVLDRLAKERQRRRKRPLQIAEMAERDNINIRDSINLEHKSNWKTRALDEMAERHRVSIEDKSVLVRKRCLTSLELMLKQDPLGCAIYLSLGIGLDFRFDHMKPPPKGTEPSTHLLQARAAKSAVKRAVELFDAEGVKRKLDAITDPEQRKRIKTTMRYQTQEELDYMARRLTELIPRKSSPSSVDSVRSTEMLKSILQRKEQSPSTQWLLQKYAPKLTPKRETDGLS